jgi:D-glycero-D-manno-heptose 1,7-bisphosphate phosphatase
MTPAVFLDRDGTIIEHVHHLSDARDVRLIEGAGPALAALQRAGFVNVVVTNQSVIGRGRLTRDGLREIHASMNGQLAEYGVTLDRIYHCPLLPNGCDPEVVEHPDRKPGPGMLQRAAAELQLDLPRSWMVGDMISDMLAGRNAGCGRTILVRSGRGATVDPAHEAIDHVVDDLSAAAELILSQAAFVGPGRRQAS